MNPVPSPFPYLNGWSGGSGRKSTSGCSRKRKPFLSLSRLRLGALLPCADRPMQGVSYCFDRSILFALILSIISADTMTIIYDDNKSHSRGLQMRSICRSWEKAHVAFRVKHCIIPLELNIQKKHCIRTYRKRESLIYWDTFEIEYIGMHRK